MELERYARMDLQARGRMMFDAQTEALEAGKRLAEVLVLDARAEAANLLPDVALLIFRSDPDGREVEIVKAVRQDGKLAHWGDNDALVGKVDEMVIEALRTAQQWAGNRAFEFDSTSTRAGLYQIRLR